MALVVEDGSGKTDAESYLSVADADTYHTKHGGSTDWSGAETADKEEALRMATQYLDAVYHERWEGRRVSRDQALDWPRGWVEDRDGFAVDSDDIPAKLEDACAELAVRHITETDGLLPDLSDPGIVASEAVAVGPVKVSTQYMGGNSPVTEFRIVEALLRGLIRPVGEIQRA